MRRCPSCQRRSGKTRHDLYIQSQQSRGSLLPGARSVIWVRPSEIRPRTVSSRCKKCRSMGSICTRAHRLQESRLSLCLGWQTNYQLLRSMRGRHEDGGCTTLVGRDCYKIAMIFLRVPNDVVFLSTKTTMQINLCGSLLVSAEVPAQSGASAPRTFRSYLMNLVTPSLSMSFTTGRRHGGGL